MRRVFRQISELLEMIKIGHSVLAMPFAFMGAMLAARGLPTPRIVFYLVVAMVGARSAAMAFNRLADASLDALNPRTADRALPGGRVSRQSTIGLIIVSSGVFIFAAAQLNRVCLLLSPLALGLILGYSLTKRFTAASHLILGLCLGITPVAGWLAVRPDLGMPVLALGLAVIFWVAGFDMLYALQDEEFDRRSGLFSLPARLGGKRSRQLAAGCHVAAMGAFLATGFLAGLGQIYIWATLAGGLMLLSQHLYLAFRTAFRLPPAFFTCNGLIGIGLALATWVSLSP